MSKVKSFSISVNDVNVKEVTKGLRPSVLQEMIFYHEQLGLSYDDMKVNEINGKQVVLTDLDGIRQIVHHTKSPRAEQYLAWIENDVIPASSNG